MNDEFLEGLEVGRPSKPKYATPKISNQVVPDDESFGTNFVQGLEQGYKSLASGGAYALTEIGSYFTDDDTWADELKLWADEYKASAPEADGTVGQFLGSLVPSIIPTAGAIAAAPFTGGTSAAVASMSILGLSSMGSGMQEYDSYKKSKGEEATNLGRLSVGVAYGLAEAIPERIGLGFLMPKATGKLIMRGSVEGAERAGRSLLGKLYANNPAKTAQILKSVGKASTVEGVQESVTELLQLSTDLGFKDTEDLPTWGQVGENVVKAFAGGAIMGAGIGPLSYASNNYAQKERRKKNGRVLVAEDKELGEAVEIVSYSPNSDEVQVITPSGSVEKYSASRLGETVELTPEVFQNILNSKYSESKIDEEIKAFQEEQILKEQQKEFEKLSQFAIDSQEGPVVQLGRLRQGDQEVDVILSNKQVDPNDPDQVYAYPQAGGRIDLNVEPIAVSRDNLLQYREESLEMYRPGKVTATPSNPIFKGETFTMNGETFRVVDIYEDSQSLDVANEKGEVEQISKSDFMSMRSENPNPVESLPVDDKGNIIPKSEQTATVPEARELQLGENTYQVVDNQVVQEFNKAKEAQKLADEINETLRNAEAVVEDRTDSDDLFAKNNFVVTIKPRNGQKTGNNTEAQQSIPNEQGGKESRGGAIESSADAGGRSDKRSDSGADVRTGRKESPARDESKEQGKVSKQDDSNEAKKESGSKAKGDKVLEKQSSQKGDGEDVSRQRSGNNGEPSVDVQVDEKGQQSTKGTTDKSNEGDAESKSNNQNTVGKARPDGGKVGQNKDKRKRKPGNKAKGIGQNKGPKFQTPDPGTIRLQNRTIFKGWLQDADGTNVFSKLYTPFKVSIKKDVEKHVATLLKGWSNAPKIIVWESSIDAVLSRSVAGLTSKDLNKFNALYDESTETVHIVSDQLDANGQYRFNSIKNVENTVLHEMIGHFGIRSLVDKVSKSNKKEFRKEFDSLMDKVYESYKEDPLMQRLSRDKEIKGSGGYGVYEDGVLVNEREIAEEFIAHNAEGGIDSSLMDQIVSFLRKVWANITGKEFSKLDDVDLRVMIGNARKLVRVGDSLVDRKLFKDQYKKQILQPNEFKDMVLGRRTASEPRFQKAPSIDSKEFKDWFGDSKVVNEDGSPMVVYHGSPTKGITQFEPRIKGADAIGSWFSSSKSSADRFSTSVEIVGGQWVNKTGEVYESYLSIQNPWILKGDKGFDEYMRIFKDKTGVTQPGAAKKEDIDRFKEYLSLSGKDGIIIKGMPEANGADYYVALEPTQIKSATGNQGTYDPNNPDIRFQRTLSQEERIVPSGKTYKAVDDQLIEVGKKFSKGAMPKAVSLKDASTKSISDFHLNQIDDRDNPQAIESYESFMKDTLDQYNALVDAGYVLEPWMGEGEPYARSKEMIDDVRKNKHLYYLRSASSTGQNSNEELDDYILLRDTGIKINGDKVVYNDLFRAVHDVFGHAMAGNSFSPQGEMNVYMDHGTMYSDKAQNALALETMIYNFWYKHNQNYSVRKVYYVPDEVITAAKNQTEYKPVVRFQKQTKETQAHMGRQYQSFFSDVTKGKSDKYKPNLSKYAPVMEMSEDVSNFQIERYKHRGKFDEHIMTSIPGFDEIQAIVGQSIVDTFQEANMLDIGASEGSTIKAIGSLSKGGIKGIALDPNQDMKSTFDSKGKVDGIEYSLSAFVGKEMYGETLWDEETADGGTLEIKGFDPKGKKFDIVHEAMVFQFIDDERSNQLDAVKEMMSQEGIAIFEEKFTQPHQPEVQQRVEDKKDKYKAQFYDESQLSAKERDVLRRKKVEGEQAATGMANLQVPVLEFERMLSQRFKYVYQFWDSGNFKGYVASDSTKNLAPFISNLQAKPHEYQEVQVPRPVKSFMKEQVRAIKDIPMIEDGGVTINPDGSVYSDGGLVIPVQTLNTTQSEISEEMIQDFITENRNIANQPGVKFGLYKFKGQDTVSIDMSVVVPSKNRETGLKFGAWAGQESLYDLDIDENVKTGATGMDPVTFTEDEFIEIATAMREDRLPSFMNTDEFTGKDGRGYTIEASTAGNPTVKVIYDGKIVGVATFDDNGNVLKGLDYDYSVSVVDDHKQNGVATYMYDFAESFYGKKIEPAGKLSDEGKGFWKKRNYTNGSDRSPKFQRKSPVEAIQESNFNNHMTEEGDNFVFYHYGPEGISKNDPTKFGNSSITSKEEKARGGGSTFFYTKPNEAEPGVGPVHYKVEIPKDKVYPFNLDPLNLYDEAKKRFQEKYGNLTFSPNSQVAFITQVANEKGYDMVVARWNLERNDDSTNVPLALRAETTKNLRLTEVAPQSLVPRSAPKGADQTPSSETGNTSNVITIKKGTAGKKKIKFQLTSRNFDESKIVKATLDELEGARAFVFAADRMVAGTVKSPSGVEQEFMGGFFYPYISGTGGWAFTDEVAAKKVLSKVKESDGIGLVMLQAEDGIKGSFSFAKYVQQEYTNAISKGVKENEVLKFINKKLDAKVTKSETFRQLLKRKSGKTKFSSIDDLADLMPFEGKGKFSYEERGKFLEVILNAENEKRFGIPRLKYGKDVKNRPNKTMVDYVNDPAFKDLEYGDVIGAIRFNKDSKIIDTRGNRKYKDHPSYPFIIEGAPIMLFEEAYDIRDIAPEFVPKSENANKTPLKDREKVFAARSAMGGQPVVRFQNANDNFYSNSLKAMRNISQPKGTVDQWKAMLLKNGASQVELDWIGFDDQFADRKSVSKEELMDFIASNQIEVVDVMKGESVSIEWVEEDEDGYSIYYGTDTFNYFSGDFIIRENDYGYTVEYPDGSPDQEYGSLSSAKGEVETYVNSLSESLAKGGEVKYSQYTLPGGENYKELLLTMPEAPHPKEITIDRISKGEYDYTVFFSNGQQNRVGKGVVGDNATDNEVKDYFKNILSEMNNEVRRDIPNNNTYKSSHWEEPNILAHIRFNEREVNGEKVLFIEEIQSDWAQEGRKKGWKDEEAEASYEDWFNDNSKLNNLNSQIKRKENQLYEDAVDKGDFETPKEYGDKLKSLGYIMGTNMAGDNMSYIYKDDSGELMKKPSEKVDISVLPKSIRGFYEYLIEFRANEIVPLQKEFKEIYDKWGGYTVDEYDGESLVLSTDNRVDSSKIGGTPQMPFKRTQDWLNLSMKRMIRYASENGFDRISWVNGQQSAERYDLSNQVDEIQYFKYDKTKEYMVTARKGAGIIFSKQLKESELESTFGKEIAEKMINEEGQTRSGEMDKFLSGLDLKVGGEGMKSFYDKIVPNTTSKLLKKLDKDVKMEVIDFNAESRKMFWEEPLQADSETFDDEGGYIVHKGVRTRDEAEIFVVDRRPVGGGIDIEAPEATWTSGATSVEEAKKEAQIHMGIESLTDGSSSTTQMSFPVSATIKQKATTEGMPLFQRRTTVDNTDGEHKAFFDRATDTWEAVRIKIQDSQLPVRRLIEEYYPTIAAVPDALNPYSKQNTEGSRIHAKMSEFMDKMSIPFQEKIKEIAGKSKVSYKEISDYIYARAAKERNAEFVQMGIQERVDKLANLNSRKARPNLSVDDVMAIDKMISRVQNEIDALKNNDFSRTSLQKFENNAGMTNKEADEIIAKFEGAVDNAKELIDANNSLVSRINEMAYEYGLITKDKFKSRAKAKDYAPLRGFEDMEMDDPTVFSGEFKAKGRTSKAGDPIAYLHAMAQTVIHKGEQNLTKKALLEFVKENPSTDLYEIKQSWYVKNTKEDGSDQYIEVHDKPDSNYRENVDPEKTEVIHNPIEKSDVLVMVDGRRVKISFYGSQGMKVANAIKGTDMAKTGPLLRFIGTLNRKLTKLYTTYSPEFMMRNFLRDMITIGINIRNDHGIKVTNEIYGRIPKSAKTLRNAIRKGDYSGKYGSYLKQFEMGGGFTGFASLKDVGEFKKDIERFINQVNNPKKLGGDAWKKSLKFIDDYNMIIENTGRLATYITLREKGVSNDKAIQQAKDVSVNFNRRGEWSGNMGALYLFINAGIQGTERLTRAFFSPNVVVRRRAIQTAIMLPSMSIALSMFNRLMAGKDDDDEFYYDKLPDYVRQYNLSIPNLFSEKEGDFFQIPLPYGFNVFFAIPDHFTRFLMGKETSTEMLLNSFSVAHDSFNPMGGIDLTTEGVSGAENALRLATPTALDPLVDFTVNRNFAGLPIWPETFPGQTPKPDSQQYFRNVNPVLRDFAHLANKYTGGDDEVGGYIDINPEKMEHLIGSYGGGAFSFANNMVTFFSNLYSDPLNVASFDGDKIEKIPVIRNYIEYPRDYQVQSDFFSRAEEVKRTLDIYDRYIQSGQKQRAIAYRNENKNLFSLAGLTKGTEKRAKELRDRLRSIDDRTMSGKAAKERLEKQLEKLYLRYNLRYNKYMAGEKPLFAELMGL